MPLRPAAEPSRSGRTPPQTDGTGCRRIGRSPLADFPSGNQRFHESASGANGQFSLPLVLRLLLGRLGRVRFGGRRRLRWRGLRCGLCRRASSMTGSATATTVTTVVSTTASIVSCAAVSCAAGSAAVITATVSTGGAAGAGSAAAGRFFRLGRGGFRLRRLKRSGAFLRCLTALLLEIGHQEPEPVDRPPDDRSPPLFPQNASALEAVCHAESLRDGEGSIAQQSDKHSDSNAPRFRCSAPEHSRQEWNPLLRKG